MDTYSCWSRDTLIPSTWKYFVLFSPLKLSFFSWNIFLTNSHIVSVTDFVLLLFLLEINFALYNCTFQILILIFFFLEIFLYKLTLGTLSVWQTPSLRSRSRISQEKTLGHSAFVLQKVIFRFPFCKKVVYYATSPFFQPPCILRSFWPQLAWKSSVLSHRSHGAWCCRSRSTCNKQLQCRKAMEASGGHIGTRQILPCVKKKISSELGIKSISTNLKWESNRNWV